jgi:hypothetical protein
VHSVISAVRAASPRHRRWQRLLGQMTLDPAELPEPLEQPSDRDFIICGLPRSGTSLLSAMLHQPPRIVTVLEPWDGMRLAPKPLFDSLRKEISEDGGLTRGKLDTDRLEADGDVVWRSEGRRLALDVDEGFFLGVKWPAFWRYLELLPTTRFLVCLRDPFQVVASFKRVGGRLREGRDYDTAFNRSMNDELLAATDDVAVRRALLYEFVAARIAPALPRPNVLPVRYERWFADADALMRELEAFLRVQLDETVHVRPPRSEEGALSSRERGLVRDLCSSAEAIGYVV